MQGIGLYVGHLGADGFLASDVGDGQRTQRMLTRFCHASYLVGI